MVESAQELHKAMVCNSRELHTSKSCNCFATGDATATQPDAIKSRALAVLRRNKERNSHATAEKIACNNQCNNQPKVASKVASVRDKRLQVMSSDFAWFCLSHQNTYPDGHCPVKNNKRDPMTDCIGWQMKSGKVVVQ